MVLPSKSRAFSLIWLIASSRKPVLSRTEPQHFSSSKVSYSISAAFKIASVDSAIEFNLSLAVQPLKYNNIIKPQYNIFIIFAFYKNTNSMQSLITINL